MKRSTRVLSLLLSVLLLAGCGKDAAEPETIVHTQAAGSDEATEEILEQTEYTQSVEPTEAPREKEKTQLSVVVGQYSQDSVSWWQAFEMQFEAENSDVDLVIVPMSWMELSTIGTDWTQREDKPDILNSTAAYCARFRQEGQLLPAEAYLSPETREAIYPRFMQWYEADGSVWSAPILSIPWVMIYNPEILEVAGVSCPSDWESLVSTCWTIKALNADILPFGVDLLDEKGLLLCMLNNGGGLVDGNGEWFINSDENLEAIQFLTNMFHAGMVGSDVITAEWYTQRELFEQGKTAMMLIPMNGLSSWECAVPWKIAPIPAKAGCESASIAIVDHFACFDKNQSQEELDAMRRFFDFFYEDARHLDYVTTENMFPVTAGSGRRMAEAEPSLEALDEILASAFTLPNMKNGWLDIFMDLQDFMRMVLEDGENPARLLDELQYEAGGR